MKGKLNLIIGLYALINVILYLVQCPSFDCNQTIFGIELSGIVYLIFWTIMSIIILYGVYKSNVNKEAEG